MRVTHTFEPFYNKNSKILILGSMPSVKSREVGFYYMHPQNRFWKVLEKVYGEEIGDSIEEKKKFLSSHNIALWDVIESCEITGSSDSSIKNVKVNNISKLISETEITKIFTTGKKAYNLYNKYVFPKTKIKAHLLFSSSPANCAIKMEDMIKNYQELNKK